VDRKSVPWWVSVLSVAVALILIVQAPRGKQVEDLGSQVFAPFAVNASGMADSVGEFWRTVQSIGILSRTATLQAEEIERLKFELVRMQELEIENEDLRKLLGFKEGNPNLRLTPVHAVGTDPTGLLNAVILDKGSNEGIREDMAVITWRGLVGRIIDVSPTMSSMLLITDINSSIAGRVQTPESRAVGVVAGRKEGGLIMRHILQQETIQTGDLVISSGVGGTIPSGIPVGKVVRVQKRNVEMFQEAILEPAADTNKLERLYVVHPNPDSE
jgi:rod shape-determining protein MreC